MLAGDFYIITKLDASNDSINADLEINMDHKIFEGHFPGQPVVPGVCMMQMIKEVLEEAIGKKTRLVKSDYAKFLAMIDPRIHEEINAAIKYATTNNEMQVTASLFKDEIVFLKLKCVLVDK
ncbi:MAG: 3-hydroxyacyl-ACP dehydratase [Bacteroidetes bacterium]|nr:3-hydroxyacyl-ACP dehydratase [Bacteroidota bacterium]